ncbi:unnamed protein product [Rotaria sp. Silwood1]|nr:unnamed protein product [Rotaria sp. Silwood1]CAF3944881.1 unnamed protein product [Rotaria sp. Silwood1]CAF4054025.1 unnamed protein product [Rotaria sp. Silwood1]CAF4922648.1 unnamed protein product [Rotaria sp. Silwood1]CAF4975000.1 unnamed protein product [Rotaria sp. Silwood1]
MALRKDTCNNVDPKDLPKDAQGHRYELGSSVQAFTEQEKNLNNNKKQQKKKKRRGNRKQQHQRRRLRLQQQKQYNITDQHMG